jgi:hypothetical protein
MAHLRGAALRTSGQKASRVRRSPSAARTRTVPASHSRWGGSRTKTRRNDLGPHWNTPKIPRLRVPLRERAPIRRFARPGDRIESYAALRVQGKKRGARRPHHTIASAGRPRAPRAAFGRNEPIGRLATQGQWESRATRAPLWPTRKSRSAPLSACCTCWT